MNIKKTLIKATKDLLNITNRPRLEAEILLSHHLDKARIYLMTHDGDEVESIDDFWALVDRRVKYEPIEYITNRVSFYDMELYVASGALIPRPETELLVEEAAEIIRREGMCRIAEIGIGSGAISIALARLFPQLQIIASDISEEALAVARHNVEAFGLQERIMLRHSSLLDGIDAPVEMIISNPPYIARHTPLAPNVAEYEPHTALYSEERGDELLKEIILVAKERGVRHLACEMGYDQKQSIAEFVQGIGDYSISFYRDLAGLDRGFVLCFTNTTQPRTDDEKNV